MSSASPSRNSQSAGALFEGWLYHVGTTCLGYQVCRSRYLIIRGKYVALYSCDPRTRHQKGGWHWWGQRNPVKMWENRRSAFCKFTTESADACSVETCCTCGCSLICCGHVHGIRCMPMPCLQGPPTPLPNGGPITAGICGSDQTVGTWK